MSKVYLVTVSDDRLGRKGGYEKIQNNIEIFFKNHDLGLEDIFNYKWKDIYNSEFYKENESLLKWINPDLNGRVYKPYVILESLKKINDNDYLVYNDCSPEHWKFANNKIPDIKKKVNLEILKKICNYNKDIITAYNTGDYKGGWRGGPGPHTHERMTHPTCIRKMKCEVYTHCLQHASGMIIMKKTDRIVKFVEEWLHFNKMPECSGMCNTNILEETNTEFVKKEDKYLKHLGGGEYFKYWDEGLEENPRLHGHRHDQSISGLLLNKMDHKLINIEKTPFFGRFNFLEYCRYGQEYKFIDSMRRETQI